MFFLREERLCVLHKSMYRVPGLSAENVVFVLYVTWATERGPAVVATGRASIRLLPEDTCDHMKSRLATGFAVPRHVPMLAPGMLLPLAIL